MGGVTPLMAQYRSIKSRYHDCVLLFRVGDFYETFYEDAVDVSRILNIALTTRDRKKPNPIPLAGVPFHAAENYITRLLAAGRKVAICEQVEDAAQAKGLVKRDVVEVLTPGTAMSTQLLDSSEHNYCLALHIEADRAGVALIDVSTGDLVSGEDGLENIQRLVQGKRVREIIFPPGTDREHLAPVAAVLGQPFLTEVEASLFSPESVDTALGTQFDGNDTETRSLERTALGALLAHCQSLVGGPLPQVVGRRTLDEIEFLTLDDETIRNLELFEPMYGAERRATLIHLIDKTLTPMGGRELRLWLQKPLCRVDLIEHRLEAVSAFYGDAVIHENTASVLKSVHDLQRIATRIAARKAIPRELHALRESLEKLPELIVAAADSGSRLIEELRVTIGDHGELANLIAGTIVEDPPGHLRDGGVIREGYSDALDTMIRDKESARRWIAGLERREKESTKIPSLKVGFNKVFGYYIEVPKTHAKSVPGHYVGKQTLVNAERYYTQELKEKEQLILETEEKRVKAEQEAFDRICGRISDALPMLQVTAAAVARLDVLQSLAASARQYGFRRPIVDDSRVLELKASRHPVLERLVSEPFVPNDLTLDWDRKQFALITGPNMSGKSTFLRQVALVVILAQTGSFVPAERARIGLVDSIFTRVGAGDRLSRGESTFLVEMKETAYILDQMTDRSLVLLDEVGRGTSTYDGLSIAWAMTEYLLQAIKARPKTLFATHFHELTQLRSAYPRLVNLKITIREWEGGIVFLRKIVPGTSDRSYGIHAARVAGLPAQVLKRAEEILHTLELRRDLLRQGVALGEGGAQQFSLFTKPLPASPESASNADTDDAYDILRRKIAGFDIDASTPLDALQFLKSLQDDLA